VPKVFPKKFEGSGPGHCFGEIKGNGTKFMVGNFGSSIRTGSRLTIWVKFRPCFHS
jgi:hypothetical protein